MGRERFVSLRTKMTIGVILVCFLMGSLAVFSVNRIATRIIDEEYKSKAEQVSEAIAKTIDPDEVSVIFDEVLQVYGNGERVVPSTEWGSDEWNEYMADYEGIEDLPLFSKIRDQFRVYQDIYKVDCVYMMEFKKDVTHAIYILDAAEEDACPPGVVDSFEDGVWPEEKDAPIPATITNEDVYGWLVTAAYPVFKDGKLVTHVCVDISMNDIKARERSYILLTVLVMLGLTAVMLVFALWYVGRSVIRPVVRLSDTAKNYCSESSDVEHHAFEKLEIMTHDEIGQLLASMKQMETDMNASINTVIDTKVALKESQELASKDSLTGIRNKTAYDHEVRKLEADLADGFNEFGLAMVDLNFLKRINDTYGHEKGNISIRRLCMLVCEVFEHSPVFRVGGDEFIVVLKNSDYRNVDSLIYDFNLRLEAVQNDATLQPWEQISAAIGYHKFDKTVDKTVDDVFKEADKAMYERKTAMKAARKD